MMMKKHATVIILAAFLVLLSGCGAARISFDVPVPAALSLPDEVKSVTIINRSVPGNPEANMLEGLLTGEGLEQDSSSTLFVLRGLDETMRNSGRFRVVRAPGSLSGSGIGNSLPLPLQWDMVDELCGRYKTDALIALESYDSDFIITSAGAGNNLLDVHARGLVTVNCGFRLYHPAGRRIVDEFMYSHKSEWGAGGIPVLAAADALINKKKAVENASLEAGTMYGRRLIPGRVYVSRDYFKKGKGNNELATGARMMELNDWNKAIASLREALQSGKRKVRGRAAHNLAVIYEILGDLYQAKEWTTAAWGRYKEKKSREYGYILTRRIHEIELLE